MLDEDLIKRDDYKDIAEQLITWDDSKCMVIRARMC